MTGAARRSARLAAAGTGAAPADAAGPSNRRERRIAGSRLTALHNDLLHRVLRTAGRPTRLVCRRFLIAYGPLSGGLQLPDVPTCADFLRRLPPPPRPPCPLPHIHTLDCAPDFQLLPALLASLPALLPTLRSLHLSIPDWRVPPRSVPYSALAPLSQTLTHIAPTQLHPDELAQLASALPALRSLRLAPSSGSDLPHHVSVLAGRLPHLEDLEIDCNARQPAAPFLRQLAGALPHLSRLILQRVVLMEWDDEATQTLASAWPRLTDIQFFFLGGGYRLAAAAALARHTTLTRLAFRNYGGLEGGVLSTLPLRELLVLQTYDDAPPVVAVAARMTALTRLVLDGSRYVLDDVMAGDLARMADSLVSLRLTISIPQWGPLARLSRLSRLQDLVLRRASRAWAEGQPTMEGQAASELAAGLTSLRCLNVEFVYRPALVQPLVACLSVHSALRELHIGNWDPRWPVRLAAVAHSLVRLSVAAHDGHQVPLVISSLQRLHQLLLLQVKVASLDSPVAEHATAAVAAGAVTQAETGQEADAATATEWPEWDMWEAGARAACNQEAGEGRVWLPPRLRVLVVSMGKLGGKLQGVLRAAAGRQGCVIRAPVCHVKQLAGWHDCWGYEEGASWEWLRGQGQERGSGN